MVIKRVRCWGWVLNFWCEHPIRWEMLEEEQICGPRGGRKLTAQFFVLTLRRLVNTPVQYVKYVAVYMALEINIQTSLACWCLGTMAVDDYRMRRKASWDKSPHVQHVERRWKRCIWQKLENGWFEDKKKIKRLWCLRYQSRKVSNGGNIAERSSDMKIKRSPSDLATTGAGWP